VYDGMMVLEPLEQMRLVLHSTITSPMAWCVKPAEKMQRGKQIRFTSIAGAFMSIPATLNI
jgi:hypothetical protein